MRIKQPGFIDEGLWLLGSEESCVYLLEGSHSSALISAGMSYVLPDILRQMCSWGINENKIEHIIILHAHFDHVGVVPYLKRKWPHVTIYASARGWNVLFNPKAVSVINDYTLKVCRRILGSTDALSTFDWQWRDDVSGQTLTEHSQLDLGGKIIEFYDTPGHSSCSISAYLPHLNALLPSDAAAIPYRDEYIIAAGSSFNQYKQSLDKLARLKVDLLCADHYGYVKGGEASDFLTRSKIATDQMIEAIMEATDKEDSVEQAAATLVKHHYEKRPDYFVAPEILLGTYMQMLRQFAPQIQMASHPI
jgi:glyoxylase-like metal-dependent hydrolase (beta-lactamase superfamily II)